MADDEEKRQGREDKGREDMGREEEIPQEQEIPQKLMQREIVNQTNPNPNFTMIQPRVSPVVQQLQKTSSTFSSTTCSSTTGCFIKCSFCN